MAGLARSGEVGMMVSASASSVIEVEQEAHVSRYSVNIHALEWKDDDIYLKLYPG